VTRPILAAAALASAAALISALLAACGSEPAPPDSPIAPAPSASDSPDDSAGTWARVADQSASAARAGLPMLGQEMLAVHYHAHLDLLVRGVPVAVPAGVGIDSIQQQISPLHTHDLTGVVHIESEKDIPFTLGQFFTEWGQPLDASHVGPVAVAQGEQLRVYRDGKLVTGNPAALKFTKHGEFFIWVGPAGSPPSHPPSTFDFPKGL
jgi:hypothetical protein